MNPRGCGPALIFAVLVAVVVGLAIVLAWSTLKSAEHIFTPQPTSTVESR